MDTIAAIATAHGVGSIAIVRVSGRDSYDIALKLSKKLSLTPRYATLSFLYSGKDIIDESIIIYFKAPYSFTGEDIVEFQCHGGIAVANTILKEVVALGARLANPGEFSKRAFLNGKIDLTKAEAIAKIIETKSEDAIKYLSKHLRGDLKNFIEELRDKLVEILAFVEVNIDYAEEDLPLDLGENIKNRLTDIKKKLTKIVKASEQNEGLINGFNIAIIGKPNVGKSSLLNKFLNYQRAIISDIAGTTRDTIEEEIKIGSHLVRIVDTAGIREAGDSVEKIGVKRSFEATKKADIVLGVFDLSKEYDLEDEKILNILKENKDKKKIFVILNKKDLPKKFDTKRVEEFETLFISAKDDVSDVINYLKIYLDSNIKEDMILLTSRRQIESVQKAKEAIDRAIEPLNDGELELFAYEINDAIGYISSITTKFERDEILDKMFGNFCLGK